MMRQIPTRRQRGEELVEIPPIRDSLMPRFRGKSDVGGEHAEWKQSRDSRDRSIRKGKCVEGKENPQKGG